MIHTKQIHSKLLLFWIKIIKWQAASWHYPLIAASELCSVEYVFSVVASFFYYAVSVYPEKKMNVDFYMEFI